MIHHSTKDLEYAIRESGLKDPINELTMWKDLAIHLEKVSADVVVQANRLDAIVANKDHVIQKLQRENENLVFRRNQLISEKIDVVTELQTTEDKLTIALDSLKKIRALPETTYGDHWSTERALKTDDVRDICDQALCGILPIEEVRQELIEQGIDTDNLKSWISGRLKDIRERGQQP